MPDQFSQLILIHTFLTDAEIEAVSEKVVAAVAKATGGTLRGCTR